jgi:hypothetical protein
MAKKKEAKKKAAKAEGVGGLEGLLNKILTATVDRVMNYAPKVVKNGYDGLRRVMVDYVAHEIDSGFRFAKTYGYDKPLEYCRTHQELVTVVIPAMVPFTLLYFL